MQILVVINKLLDLKIVQWVLLALVIMQILSNVWFGIKYNALRLDNALLKSTAADLGAAIHIQNTEILKGTKAFADQKDVMDGAIKEAGRIAKESKEILKGIKNITLKGTCDEKVKQSLDLINSGFKP